MSVTAGWAPEMEIMEITAAAFHRAHQGPRGQPKTLPQHGTCTLLLSQMSPGLEGKRSRDASKDREFAHTRLEYLQKRARDLKPPGLQASSPLGMGETAHKGQENKMAVREKKDHSSVQSSLLQLEVLFSPSLPLLGDASQPLPKESHPGLKARSPTNKGEPERQSRAGTGAEDTYSHGDKGKAGVTKVPALLTP